MDEGSLIVVLLRYDMDTRKCCTHFCEELCVASHGGYIYDERGHASGRQR